MVNINSEVIVERIQKDGVNTIIIAAVIAILSWIFNMYHKSANKYRDQKDQQFREARATFESAFLSYSIFFYPSFKTFSRNIQLVP